MGTGVGILSHLDPAGVMPHPHLLPSGALWLSARHTGLPPGPAQGPTWTPHSSQPEIIGFTLRQQRAQLLPARWCPSAVGCVRISCASNKSTTCPGQAFRLFFLIQNIFTPASWRWKPAGGPTWPLGKTPTVFRASPTPKHPYRQNPSGLGSAPLTLAGNSAGSHLLLVRTSGLPPFPCSHGNHLHAIQGKNPKRRLKRFF